MNDKDVVDAIESVALQNDLEVSKRRHSGNFCTVYLSAHEELLAIDQVKVLVKARQSLVEAGLGTIALDYYDNPPFLNRNTGRMETGHPRHGDPMLVIESVWWEPGVTHVEH